MKKLFVFLFTIALCAAVYAAPASIAVMEFETGDFCTPDEAALMTDALRNEMVRQTSGRADIIDRAHTEALTGEMVLSMSDWINPSKVKAAGNFLGADYFMFGSLKVMNGTNYLQAQMTEVETGRIVHSSRVALSTWQDFEYKAASFAKEFAGKISTKGTFDGTWTADILHGDFIDSYSITFTGANRCAIKVTSSPLDVTEETQGICSLAGDIFKVTAIFKNSRIAHIRSLQWSSVISSGEGSFNMMVKPVSGQNKQIRATFTKEE